MERIYLSGASQPSKGQPETPIWQKGLVVLAGIVALLAIVHGVFQGVLIMRAITRTGFFKERSRHLLALLGTQWHILFNVTGQCPKWGDLRASPPRHFGIVRDMQLDTHSLDDSGDL